MIKTLNRRALAGWLGGDLYSPTKPNQAATVKSLRKRKPLPGSVRELRDRLFANPVPYPTGMERPRTRGACEGGERPCPWVSCRYHLAFDVTPGGSLKVNFPDRDVADMPETCALDVADRGGCGSLSRFASVMNLSFDRAAQVTTEALTCARETATQEGCDLALFVRPSLRKARASRRERRGRTKVDSVIVRLSLADRALIAAAAPNRGLGPWMRDVALKAAHRREACLLQPSTRGRTETAVGVPFRIAEELDLVRAAVQRDRSKGLGPWLRAVALQAAGCPSDAR